MNPNLRPAISGIDWMISRAVKRVESEAASQETRLRHAKTIEEVVRAASVSVPAEIRFMRNSIRGLRNLEVAAERRIQELLEPRLKGISESESASDAKSKRGRLIQDCSMLRGNFPRQYGFADRESRRLVYLKELAEKPTEAGQGDSPTD